MAETVIINTEAAGLPTEEQLTDAREEALLLLDSDDPEAIETARKILESVRRLKARVNAAGPVEERRELTAEEEIQRQSDEQEGRQLVRRIRKMERNARLTASDWSQLPDAPLTETKRQEWTTYRQALRDLDMTTATWPDEPATQ